MAGNAEKEQNKQKAAASKQEKVEKPKKTEKLAKSEDQKSQDSKDSKPKKIGTGTIVKKTASKKTDDAPIPANPSQILKKKLATKAASSSSKNETVVQNKVSDLQKTLCDLKFPEPPKNLEEFAKTTLSVGNDIEKAKADFTKWGSKLSDLLSEVQAARNDYKRAAESYQETNAEIRTLVNLLSNKQTQNNSEESGCGTEVSKEGRRHCGSIWGDGHRAGLPASLVKSDLSSIKWTTRWSGAKDTVLSDALTLLNDVVDTIDKLWTRSANALQAIDMLEADRETIRTDVERLASAIDAQAATLSHFQDPTKSTPPKSAAAPQTNGVCADQVANPTRISYFRKEPTFSRFLGPGSNYAFEKKMNTPSSIFADERVKEIEQKQIETKIAMEIKLLNVPESKSSRPTTYRREEFEEIVRQIKAHTDSKIKFGINDIKYCYRLTPSASHSEKGYEKVLIVGLMNPDMVSQVLTAFDETFRAKHMGVFPKPKRFLQRSMTLLQRQAAATKFQEAKRLNLKEMESKKLSSTDDLEHIWIVKYTRGYPKTTLAKNRKFTPPATKEARKAAGTNEQKFNNNHPNYTSPPDEHIPGVTKISKRK